jgi:hypothetical protein
MGHRVDWDVLLCGEIDVVGRDLELLVRLGRLQLYRGPMGKLERDGDKLLFRPELVVVWRHGDPDQHIARPSRENAPRVCLVDHDLVELPDSTLVMVGRVDQRPVYCLHAAGNNIMPPSLVGPTAQG